MGAAELLLTGTRQGFRVAVVLEPGRRGAAALEHARALARTPGSELTVVAVAPKAEPWCRGCGGLSPAVYNCAVRDETVRELHEAAVRLGADARAATFKLLVEGRDPPVDAWIAEGVFDVVVVPPRRRVLGPPSIPAVRRLRRCTHAGVRVVRAPRRVPATR